MKKLLLVLAIAGFATACNNDSDSKTETVDTTATEQTVTPSVDTTHVDTTKMATDTTKM